LGSRRDPQDYPQDFLFVSLLGNRGHNPSIAGKPFVNQGSRIISYGSRITHHERQA
jgi:hypothetical protein